MNDLVGLNIDGRSSDEPTDADVALAAGLLAAVTSLVAGWLLWWLTGTPLIPLRVVDAIFAVTPAEIVQVAVAFLGPWAKRLAFAASVGGYLLILAFAGRAFESRVKERGILSSLSFGIGIWLLSSLTVFPLAGGGLFGVAWRPNAWAAVASLFAVGVVYGVTLDFFRATLHRDRRLAVRASQIASRRTFFGSIVAAGVAVVLFEGLRSIADATGWGRSDRVSGGSGVFPEIDGLSLEVTPTPDFYHVSKNVFDPDVSPRNWRLELGGLVDRPLSLSLDDLRALPAVEGFATLACIDNPAGGDLIGNAFWRGVGLADLLRAAGVRDGAVDVVFTASDDYVDSISIERAMMPGCMLAYEMNGMPLNSAHGAPLRLIVPGLFGLKNVKWIARIDVAASDVKGYWQRRGWDDTAEYQTMSRIDVATAGVVGQPATLAGVAFAGDRGVTRVEVSTDNGASWVAAKLRPPLSPSAWVLWHASWTPQIVGRFEAIVRAVDGTGTPQSSNDSSAFPHGVTGLHRVAVRVTA
jgi:DMSO/TMAO reductase YedYZ molybdopterin-dependent catalytic subunit